jgi:hypothetical protein
MSWNWSLAPHCRRWSASRHSPRSSCSTCVRTVAQAKPWCRSPPVRCSGCAWPRRHSLRRHSRLHRRPRPAHRRAGSVITPMNCVMASNVVCCEAVPVSPDTCVRPDGVRTPNAMGMPPVALKKFTSALPTAAWLPLSPPKFGAVGGVGVGGVGVVGVKFSASFR